MNKIIDKKKRREDEDSFTKADRTINRLSKKMTDDLRESFKRLAPKLWIMAAVDSEFEAILNEYRGLVASNKFMQKQFSISIDQAVKDKIKERLSKLSTERSPLKFMQKEVKEELCTLVEQVQLIRVLDESIIEELEEYGAIETFDRVDKMHIKEAKKRKKNFIAAVKKHQEQIGQKGKR